MEIKKSLHMTSIACHNSMRPSSKKMLKAKKTKNLSINGSRKAPSFEELLNFLAKYPSTQSVITAQRIARPRKVALSDKNKKAKGARSNERLFETLNIFSN